MPDVLSLAANGAGQSVGVDFASLIAYFLSTSSFQGRRQAFLHTAETERAQCNAVVGGGDDLTFESARQTRNVFETGMPGVDRFTA